MSIAIVAGVILCTVLPFLPGRYDPLAVAASSIAQIMGKASALFVPIGVLWFLTERREAKSWRHRLALAAVCIEALLAVLAVVIALALSGFVFAAIILALSIFQLRRAIAALQRVKQAPAGAFQPVALALAVLPIAIVAIQAAIAGPAADSSRNRAIHNSAGLIAHIERYRAAHGRYPLSLLSLWSDYDPGVIGVERYRYEMHGASYNLSFEHPSFVFGTREIVLYNPRDEQTITSHDMDLLEFTGAALELRRGYYKSESLSTPKWKVFYFD